MISAIGLGIAGTGVFTSKSSLSDEEKGQLTSVRRWYQVLTLNF